VNRTVRKLTDGSAKYAEKLGPKLDLTTHAMGVSKNHYAVAVDDGVVTGAYVEASGK
jgi:peroxiredoxin